MKQKYAIRVADIEMNVISDASKEEVENIASILDRRMREFTSRGSHCTRNEAAILCALSYCSERMALQDAFKKTEKDVFTLTAENEKLKKSIEELQKDLATARKDAEVLRNVLEKSTLNATKPEYTPKPFGKKEEIPAEENAKEPAPTATAPTMATAPAETPSEPTEEKKKATPKTKSRVGSMFDLLTFSDV